MNQRINPCENFYEFACGNWKKGHRTTGLAQDIQLHLTHKLRTLLEQMSGPNEPRAVRDAKELYQSCLMADGTLDNDSYGLLLETLIYIGLASDERKSRYADELIDWTSVFVKIKRHLNYDFPFTIDIHNLNDYQKTIGIFTFTNDFVDYR
ncbi:Neprilysin-11 [Blattella germanica]|nr:Neprilysin-11 [Blattella germanica]